GPVRMVDTGPYTAIRHPSVLGKLLGVTGLGIIWQSQTFLLGFLPILVIYSVVSNRLLQERFCEDRFGERYCQYRDRVPMLIPRLSGLSRWKSGKPALNAIELVSVATQPPSVWQEFRWYLVGLIGLIVCFSGMAVMTQLTH
ncbi:MAG: methyltransferase, partial [Myxococcota bacterium]|nr:methyltransferase [Myxococcota bacterium]